MRIDYKQVERDIPEIAAKVAEISGLNVPLDDLRFEVRRTFPNSLAGAMYNPFQRKIEMYKNNIPIIFSQNNANIILGHELMHHAQFSIEKFKKTIEKVSDIKQRRSLGRLVEGDATWIELELEQFYPPDVLSNLSYFPRKITLEYAGIFHVKGDIGDIYGLGRRRIDALVAEGGREAVNCLYQAGPQVIINNFSDSVIEKSITSGEKNVEATIDKVAYKIDHFTYRLEKAHQEAKKKIEEELDRAIHKINLKRAQNWLETMAKNNLELAEFKRMYDETVGSKKK